MKDTVQRTFNGVPYSLTGHSHQVSDIVDTMAFRYGKTATQSINANTPTKVAFPTSAHDFGSDWDTTNNQFHPPAGVSVGVYRIAAQVKLTNTTSGWLALYKNGINLLRLDDDGVTKSMFRGVIDVNLLSTDYIEVWLNVGSSRTIQAADTFISVSSIY